MKTWFFQGMLLVFLVSSTLPAATRPEPVPPPDDDDPFLLQSADIDRVAGMLSALLEEEDVLALFESTRGAVAAATRHWRTQDREKYSLDLFFQVAPAPRGGFGTYRVARVIWEKDSATAEGGTTRPEISGPLLAEPPPEEHAGTFFAFTPHSARAVVVALQDPAVRSKVQSLLPAYTCETVSADLTDYDSDQHVEVTFRFASQHDFRQRREVQATVVPDGEGSWHVQLVGSQ